MYYYYSYEQCSWGLSRTGVDVGPLSAQYGVCV